MRQSVHHVMSLMTIIVSITFIGCPKDPEHPPVHLPTDTADCPAACNHLRKLKCQEGDTIPGAFCASGKPKNGKCETGEKPADLTCEIFCVQTQTSGHALVPSCVVNIQKCTDMDRVNDFCPKEIP